jgi:hypothetical protein
MTAPVGDQSIQSSQGKALSVNISRGGMLLLMDQAPNIEQVLKVYVPTPITLTDTPTLAEVRWTRRVPFNRMKENESHFVGLKFLIAPNIHHKNVFGTKQKLIRGNIGKIIVLLLRPEQEATRQTHHEAQRYTDQLS